MQKSVQKKGMQKSVQKKGMQKSVQKKERSMASARVEAEVLSALQSCDWASPEQVLGAITFAGRHGVVLPRSHSNIRSRIKEVMITWALPNLYKLTSKEAFQAAITQNFHAMERAKDYRRGGQLRALVNDYFNSVHWLQQLQATVCAFSNTCRALICHSPPACEATP